MHSTFFVTVISVLLVSFISFVGILVFLIKKNRLNKILLYIVSFAAGALLGDAFIHLLPDAAQPAGFSLRVSFYVMSGIVLFFILEKFIKWQHCHAYLDEKDHVHSFAYMNLVGDALHNLLDGVIIAASYLSSVPTGIATTIAVIFHEIPQEIGDFGILIHGGFTKTRALLLNFSSALVSIAGAILTFLLAEKIANIELILAPMAAGGFIYIAASDLIPELHKETRIYRSLLQLLSFLMGIVLMAVLLFLD